MTAVTSRARMETAKADSRNATSLNPSIKPMLEQYTLLIDSSLDEERYESAISLLETLCTSTSQPTVFHLGRLTSFLFESNKRLTYSIRLASYRLLSRCIQLYGTAPFVALWKSFSSPLFRTEQRPEPPAEEADDIDPALEDPEELAKRQKMLQELEEQRLNQIPVTIWELFPNIWECMADALSQARSNDEPSSKLLIQHFIEVIKTDIESRNTVQDLHDAIILTNMPYIVFKQKRTNLDHPLDIVFACVTSQDPEFTDLGQQLLNCVGIPRASILSDRQLFILAQPINPPIDLDALERSIISYHNRLSIVQSKTFLNTIRSPHLKYLIIDGMLSVGTPKNRHLEIPRLKEIMSHLQETKPKKSRSPFEYAIAAWHLIQASLQLEMDHYNLKNRTDSKAMNTAKGIAEAWVSVLTACDLRVVAQDRRDQTSIDDSGTFFESRAQAFLEIAENIPLSNHTTPNSTPTKKLLSPTKQTPLLVRQVQEGVVFSPPDGRPRRAKARNSRRTNIMDKNKDWWLEPTVRERKRKTLEWAVEPAEVNDLIGMDLCVMTWIDALVDPSGLCK